MSDAWFALHRETIIVIFVMAVITYGFRAGGYWLMGRVTLSSRVEAGLAYLPGAVITALVVPAALEAGVEGILGLVAVAITMRVKSNLLLAMVAGVATVWLVRNLT